MTIEEKNTIDEGLKVLAKALAIYDCSVPEKVNALAALMFAVKALYKE